VWYHWKRGHLCPNTLQTAPRRMAYGYIIGAPILALVVTILHVKHASACNPGTYSLPGVTQCFSCSSGTYSLTGDTACRQCSAGYYSTTPPSGTCSICPAGKYTPSPGMGQCLDCWTGTFSNAGSTTCTTCPAGTYQTSPPSGTCIGCPAGKYAVTGLTKCLDCTIGTYSTGNTNGCTQCSAGYYASDGASTACALCPSGKRSDSSSGSILCIDCSPGYFANLPTSTCTPCPPGSISDFGAPLCLKTCPAGMYFDGSVCTSCLAGSYTESTKAVTSCTLCVVGTYQNQRNQTYCKNCAPGFFETRIASSQCFACPSGQTSKEGQTSCSLCSEGTFANLTGQSSCTKCPQMTTTWGFGATSQLFCQICDIGTYGSPGNCQNCSVSKGFGCTKKNLSVPFVTKGYSLSSCQGSVSVKKCVPIGYAGERCSSCADGYFRMETLCVPCTSQNWTLIPTVVIIILLFLFVCLKMLRTSSFHTKPSSLRISLQAIQLLSIYPSFATKWPRALRTVLNILSISVSYLMLSQISPFLLSEF
jgi:hypothetical protein